MRKHGDDMADYDKLKELMTYKCTLSDEGFEALMALGREQAFAAGEVVIKEGLVNDNLYIVKEGIIRISRRYEEKTMTLLMGDDGDVILSAFSFHGGLPAVLSIETCCESVLIRIPKQEFMALMRRSHEIALWACDVLLEQLFMLERKTTTFTGDAYERYKSMVAHRPDIMQQVPLKIIASYLGVSQSCLSRIRKQYGKDQSK